MEIKPETGGRLEVTFTTSAERKAVGGAFLEHLAQLAAHNQLEVASPEVKRAVELAKAQASPDACSKEYSMHHDELSDVAKTLTGYANDTTRRVQAMGAEDAFANPLIADRTEQGIVALALAQQITEYQQGTA